VLEFVIHSLVNKLCVCASGDLLKGSCFNALKNSLVYRFFNQAVKNCETLSSLKLLLLLLLLFVLYFFDAQCGALFSAIAVRFPLLKLKKRVGNCC